MRKTASRWLVSGAALPCLVALGAAAVVSVVGGLAVSAARAGEPRMRPVDHLPSELERATAAFPQRGRTYGRAIGEAAVTALREIGEAEVPEHSADLIVNTVACLGRSAPCCDEEVEFRKAWMRSATQRLAASPVTKEETAELLCQLGELRERLLGVVQVLRPEDAAEFDRKRLTPTFERLSEAAQSLLWGGPMRPMSAGQLADVEAEFRQIVGSDGRATSQLFLANATAHGRVVEFSTGGAMDDVPPEVNAASAAWEAAQSRLDAEAREKDVRRMNASVMQSMMGDHANYALASAAALDAFALWHEVLRSAQPLPSAMEAECSVEFWSDGAVMSACSGSVQWSSESGGTTHASLSTRGTGTTWLADAWDGLALDLGSGTCSVNLGARSASTAVSGDALPAEVHPLVQYCDTDMSAEIATQLAADRLLWDAVLALWRGDADQPVGLDGICALGLSPLMWNSRPRATSAVRGRDSVVLRDAAGQTVARLMGQGQADVSSAPSLPETMDVELAHRQVTALHIQKVVPPGNRDAAGASGPAERVVTCPLDLDVRSARLQLRSVSGVVLLDEYKVFREDGTPLCVVTFSDVQVKAAQ